MRIKELEKAMPGDRGCTSCLGAFAVPLVQCLRSHRQAFSLISALRGILRESKPMGSAHLASAVPLLYRWWCDFEQVFLSLTQFTSMRLGGAHMLAEGCEEYWAWLGGLQ